MWWGHREGTTFEVGFLALLGKCKYCNVGGINGRDNNRIRVNAKMAARTELMEGTARDGARGGTWFSDEGFSR